MSDEADRNQDIEHGETQERVRRLLAAAGGTPPRTPDDVSARLDQVLAGLIAERGSGSATDAVGEPTRELDRRRERRQQPGRHRRWSAVLVAAAAVSVLGVGVGTVLGTGSGGGDAAMSTDEAGGIAQGQAEGQAEGQAGVRGEADAGRLGPTAPVVRSRRLDADVQRIADRAVAAPGARPGALADACVQPQTGPGDEWLAVRLDGDPAVLVLRAASGGRRTADVFGCDDPRTPVVSTTVRAR